MSGTNRDTQAAWAFHDATKYTFVGEEWDDNALFIGDPALKRPGLGEQDRSIEPRTYKDYPTLDPIHLPRPANPSTMPALDAIDASGDLPAGQHMPDLDTIARICLRANGILKTWVAPSGRLVTFRQSGCTGARYHIELYLVCGDIPGLEAGLYHYGSNDHTLRQLRAGDFRQAVIHASGQEPAIASAPVIFITTSVFWRNAWRYQARTYRHTFWDTGTVLGNLLAVATDAGLPTRTVLGFVDAEINALLAVDGEREAAISLIALGRDDRPAPESPAIAPLDLPDPTLNEPRIDYPEIEAMHRASSLDSPAEVEAWRRAPAIAPPDRPGVAIPLRPLPPDRAPTITIDQVIEKRRSVRNYDRTKQVSFEDFSTVIARSGRTARLDCLAAGDPPLTNRVVIVNAVESLDPGIYLVNDDSTAITLLRAGDSSELATELALLQDYAGEAHVNAYELADLEPVLRRFGNRGYRVAQLEAAIAGARLQLAAHALGLGAVGSTSNDDRVTEAMSPEGERLSFMFVAVFGERRRKVSAANQAES